MQNIFEKIFTLRTADFDCRKRISPAAVLDLFQVVAGEHAILLGCGFDDFYKKGIIWVLVRTKYEVINEPALYQTVKVKTWPLAPSRVGFQREYLMEDEQGKPLIKGSSDWVIIDAEQRKLVAKPNVYPDIDFITEKNFDERVKKVPDFEQNGDGLTVCTGFSQLDMNGHVNNTKYANYAMDALNPNDNEFIKSFQVDYRNELKLGDEIKVYLSKNDATALIKGVNESGDIMFACKVDM
jgi:acyl-ACP thioesterase